MRKRLNELFARQPFYWKIVILLCLSVLLIVICSAVAWFTFNFKYEFENFAHYRKFENQVPKPEWKSKAINYEMPLERESFYLYVPKNLKKNKKAGLIVFINSSHRMQMLPPGWDKVLEAQNIIYAAPFNCGNQRNVVDRLSLAVLTAQYLKSKYDIDPNRVYVSGISGGADMASLVAFVQSDVFKGTIQNCGSYFYKKVWEDERYFDINCSKEEAEKAKASVKFVIVEGSEDFDREHALRYLHDGFEKEGFNIKLFDIKGMEHENCSGKTLLTVLEYLDAK